MQGYQNLRYAEANFSFPFRTHLAPMWWPAAVSAGRAARCAVPLNAAAYAAAARAAAVAATFVRLLLLLLLLLLLCASALTCCGSDYLVLPRLRATSSATTAHNGTSMPCNAMRCDVAAATLAVAVAVVAACLLGLMAF